MDYQQQAELLKLLIEHAPIGVVYFSGPEHRYTLVNAHYHQIVKGRDQNILGKRAVDVFPEAADTLIPLLDHVYATGEPYHASNMSVMLERDGRMVEEFYTFTYLRVNNLQGQADGIFVIVYETTLEVHNNREVERAYALLDTFFTSTPLGMGFVDRELRFVRINQALAQNNRLPVEAHLGKTLLELFPNSTRVQGITDRWNEILATGKSVQNIEIEGEETEGLTGTMRRYWLVNWYPVQSQGENIGVGVVLQDISERRRAEHRAQLLQELTAALAAALTTQEVSDVILNHIHIALKPSLGAVGVISDDGQRLEIINRANLPDSIMDRFTPLSLADPLPMTDAARNGEVVWIADVEEYQTRYPHLFAAVNQQTRNQAIIALPLRVSGRITGAIGLSFTKPTPYHDDDMTFLITLANQCAQALERARLYQLEQQARLEAERANTLKLQFLGMISHELRTPLTSIKGFASTLLSEDVTFPPEQQHEFIRIINDEADRLTDLVEQLLDLSRIQAGTLRMEQAPQPLERVLKIARPQLDILTRDHFLNLRIEGGLPPVLVDSQRIAQVLVNLVGNAAKFSPAATPIHVRASRQDGMVQVDISDQGVGIPPEERDTVFEAFRQTERKTPNQRLGAGLGLAICKGIVEAHGGRIWIQDQPVGTTISFILPTG